jgi:tetratricopeptide (TPR) repeat protein
MHAIRRCAVTLIAATLAACSRPAAPPPTPAALCIPGGSGGTVPATAAKWAEGAQLFGGLGDFHRRIGTASDLAQQYFDQGMRYLWAFNHDESSRSFAKAAQLDPACALCWWGLALTVGPNYNMPVMAAPRAKVAWEAEQQAQAQAAKASPVEQALVAALAQRYPNAQPLDPSNSAPVLNAYAQAMAAVAAKFPDDDDVQTLYAESLMNTNAWKLWSLAGEPAPGTAQIEAALEKVLARNPGHPGANHYYIHAMEASPHPERALASAQRLVDMMPAAGHLVHMPAHIMQRVGRYEEAAEANRRGVSADLAYYGKARPLDYYAMYTAHNYQFLAWSAAMEGRQAESLEAIKQMRALIPDQMLQQAPGADWYAGETYAALIRFGQWDRILAEPAPDPKLPGLAASHAYARTAALAAKGRVDEARTQLALLQQLAAAVPADYPAGLNTAHDVLAVALLDAQARVAIAQSDHAAAIALLKQAAELEDHLAYDEPADWFNPVRHLLGSELLRSGAAAEAEGVFRTDLARHPENGWALYGLAQALQQENKNAEAAAVRRRFDAAWKKADMKLNASVI